MKYIVLVPDGMADYPVKELGDRTPLEVSHKDNMDYLVKNGQTGFVKTIPEGVTPGSDVANLSILGYDPVKYYTGRGPLEAVNLGIELGGEDVAFRCNLITAEGDKLLDYSSGHISTKEAAVLIKSIDQKLGEGKVRFYPGVSYRHIMMIKESSGVDLTAIKCMPPHDIMGESIQKNLPKGKGAEILIDLMNKSRDILSHHEVNQVRIDLKENPGNMIWLWGQGKKPDLPKYIDKFKVTGSVISAVDLIKGLGKIIGLDVINVPGATGYYDTNYLGKAEAAIKSLRTKDFVFVHVEATDEAGHNGDIRMKIACIERFDREVVGTILKHFKGKKDFRIMVLPDHATPVSLRTHTSDPVPFAIFGQGINVSGAESFTDRRDKQAELNFNSGYELLEYFMQSS
ncbi:MAG: cofactor-independent phosphoglycerate mutase [Candidatus Omnitrophota bacterium]|nr:cofactor-independent phosphoglycerate mutase [Candidatus Omnitrophota bacterium]